MCQLYIYSDPTYMYAFSTIFYLSRSHDILLLPSRTLLSCCFCFLPLNKRRKEIEQNARESFVSTTFLRTRGTAKRAFHSTARRAVGDKDLWDFLWTKIWKLAPLGARQALCVVARGLDYLFRDLLSLRWTPPFHVHTTVEGTSE